MAVVTLLVGGRRHELACRDGDEAHLTRMAAILDEKAAQAGGALGTPNEARQLLMAGLLLADELDERRAASPAPIAPEPADDPTEGLAEALETLAERVEWFADALEKKDTSA